MKIFTDFSRTRWTIHLVPIIDLFLETKTPIDHHLSLLDGLSGVYLNIKWLSWGVTLGIFKKLKK
jgi:hypothetical protein